VSYRLSASPQHTDEHRPERPVLVAVDQQLGDGAALLSPSSEYIMPPLQDENQDDHDDHDEHHRQHELIHTHIVSEGWDRRLAVRRGPGATSLNCLALDAMCRSLLDVELEHGVLQAVISGPGGTIQYKEPLSDTFHGSTV
jgi:hypothetical protein